MRLGKGRRESSKRNYYVISPRVIIKAIIIISKWVYIYMYIHTKNETTKISQTKMILVKHN